MSKLLINETPLQFLPTLAIALGSERKAIALQQLHYMLTTPRMSEEREGRRWVRASYTDWFLEFYPCWSPDTVRKLYSALRADGFVLHRQFGIQAGDATSYLSIDYEKLDAAHAEILGTHPAKTATCHPAISVEDHPAKTAASSISKKRGKEERERGASRRPRPSVEAPPHLKNQKPPNSSRPAWMGPTEPDPRISAWRAFTTNAPLNKVQEDAILSQVTDCALWEGILKKAMLYHTRANVAKFLDYYRAGDVPVFGEVKGATKNAAESWLDAAKMNGWDVEGMVTNGN
jgi:hypothetical protein